MVKCQLPPEFCSLFWDITSGPREGMLVQPLSKPVKSEFNSAELSAELIHQASWKKTIWVSPSIENSILFFKKRLTLTQLRRQKEKFLPKSMLQRFPFSRRSSSGRYIWGVATMNSPQFVLFVLMCARLVNLAPSNQQESLNTFDYDTDILEGQLFKSNFEDQSHEAISKKGKGALIRLQRDETTTDLISTQDADLPTCLLCVCLSGSVYCEETEIEAIPPLPKETSYLYARFNKIKKITVKDFEGFPNLKRIDLTGNVIEEIEDGAFAKLLLLEQLSLADNKLTRLPALPANLTSFNANNNKIKSKAIKANTFKKMNNLSYLYLAENALETVPPNLPESLRILHLQFNNITSVNNETFCKSDNLRYVRTKMDEIRMEGNPVILGKYPDSFSCLKMLPIGSYF